MLQNALKLLAKVLSGSILTFECAREREREQAVSVQLSVLGRGLKFERLNLLIFEMLNLDIALESFK